MNILFSATRQWNPGDEFILMGCINLLRASGLEFNPIVYNRNPQIRPKGKYNRYNKLDRAISGGKYTPFLDNSYKDSHEGSYIDLIVLAGSPEWRGKRMNSLYELVNKHKIPMIILGVGSAREFSFDLKCFPQSELDAISAARLITCRDERTSTGLSGLGAHFIPCPALFSADGHESPRTSVRKIGLIYGSDQTVNHNRISSETFDYLKQIYFWVIDTYSDVQVEFVAHYVDELTTFEIDFPGQKICYSYDSKDYIDIYSRYDLVIGHRIHGIGISASQGIPGVSVSHDLRGETARGFCAEIVRVGDALDDVFGLISSKVDNIQTESHRLIEHKNQVRERYVELIRESCKEWLR